jgi:acyl-coenzyme A synthetase/AMP-(fatty) acid ligase
MNVSWLKQHIVSLVDRQFMTDRFGCYKYSDLSSQIDAYSVEIETLLSDGEVVAILADYSFYSVALFLALIEKKAIIVPVVSQSPTEIDKRVSVSGCSVIINIDCGMLRIRRTGNSTSTHSLTSRLIKDHRSGLILFSSGITGEPKAMIHDLDALVNRYQGKKLKCLNILIFLMFDHIGGLNTLLNILATGSFMVVPASRKPDHIASLIQEHQVHILPASPTFLNMMLMDQVNDKYDLSSLKMVTYGTEPMPKSLLNKLKQLFPKVKLVQTFGTSETGIVQTSSLSSESLAIKLDDPNFEYKVVENELWLKSKTQILGYLNASMDSFTEDGWFQTGDLVEELPDGYIQIVGRNKEVINVGGLKVLPTEIESVLLGIDEVSDCIVYSEKSSIMGEVVVADVVLNCQLPPKDARQIIRKFCLSKLEEYKVPVRMNFVEKTSFNERFKKIRIKH